MRASNRIPLVQTGSLYKLVENSLECKDRSLVGCHVLFTGAGRVKHWRQQFYREIEENSFYLKLLKTKRRT